MRLSRLLPTLAAVGAALALAASPGCSNFDSSTDVGSDLVNDLDSSIASPNGVMARFKATAPVDRVWSIREESTRSGDLVMVGRYADEYAWSYFQFPAQMRVPGSDKALRRLVLKLVASTAYKTDADTVGLILSVCSQKGRGEPILTTGSRVLDTVWYRCSSASGYFVADPVILPASLYQTHLDSVVNRVSLRGDDTLVGTTDTVDTNPRPLVIDTLLRDTVYLSLLLNDSDTIVRDSTQYWALRAIARDTVVLQRLVQDTAGHTDTLQDTTLVLRDSLIMRSDTTSSREALFTRTDTSVIGKGVRFSRTYISKTQYVDRVALERCTSFVTLSLDTTTDYTHVQTVQLLRTLSLPDSALSCQNMALDTTYVLRHVLDSLLIDSNLVFKSDTYQVASIDTTWFDSLTVDLMPRFFCLTPLDTAKKLLRIAKPEIDVMYDFDTASDTNYYRKTVASDLADYQVFEDAAATRGDSAVTSSAPLRYATLAIDLGDSSHGFWQTVLDAARPRGFSALLAASASLPVEASGEDDVDDSLRVRYALTTDSLVDPSTMLWTWSALDTTVLPHRVALNLRTDLDSLFLGDRPSRAYLHVAAVETGVWRTVRLRPEADSSLVRFEMVLTNPAAQP